jgi:hypothetical protein
MENLKIFLKLNKAKLMSLGLASLACTIARQRSRLRFLHEGDANTKFFHLQTCHRNRKNIIPPIMHEGSWLSGHHEKSEAIYDYFNSIPGTPFNRAHSILLDDLLPQLNLSGLDVCFSE